MRAVTISQTDAGPRLVWSSVPEPEPGPGEALVTVRTTAVNRADLAQAAGRYPPPPGVTDILGLEMAGVVTDPGPPVAGPAAGGSGGEAWQVGDRVCALLPGGGYAEKVVVPRDLLLRLPDHWSFAQGAAIPEAWLTAYVNLFLEGDLRAGQTVLIHAGGSGVGTAAVQLARQAGARVMATAGTPVKLARCRELGAEVTVNYKEEDFYTVVQAATDGAGVDVILDPVGPAYLERNLRLLRERGRLVLIGLLSGRESTVDLGLVMGRMGRLIGSRLRSRPVAEKIAITTQFRRRFWPLLADGTLQPIIDSHFPVEEAQAAHDYVRANKNTGKVILLVGAKGDNSDAAGDP